MDFNYHQNKPGPSRRHVATPAAAAAAPLYESHFAMDDFGQPEAVQRAAAQLPQHQPPRPPSRHAPPVLNTPFFTPDPSWQQQPGFGAASAPPPLNTTATAPTMFVNQQFLMAAGQQLLSNPMTAAAIDAYSQSLSDKTQGYLGNVKQYFAVDTSYALKKLFIIFLPFVHKEWSIRYNTENVTPRDEPNLPDLYIPSMAFITYILFSGYILGLRNQFAPDQLGIYASSALAWLLLEVFLIMIAKYLLNLSSSLGFFHMIAFGGYKFVCIDAILFGSVLFGQTGFYALFAYSSLALGYFLLRSLSTNLQQGSQSAYQGYDHNPRTAYYLVLFIAALQPLIMYFLTASLSSSSKTITSSN